MSYNYPPKCTFRNTYCMFLQKHGFYAPLPPPPHTCWLDELNPGGKKNLVLPSRFTFTLFSFWTKIKGLLFSNYFLVLIYRSWTYISA